MNARRKFLIGLAALFPILVRAQGIKGTGKPVRVGMLGIGTPEQGTLVRTIFLDSMRELAWIEGRNITYDRAYAAAADRKGMAEAAAELVARRPDLIYVTSNPAARAAFAATRTIPIVFSAVLNPVEFGLVQSLARPGGNVTGVTTIGWELSGKRMQLLKEAMPKISRVGVLMMDGRTPSEGLKLIEQAAGAGIRVIPAVANNPGALDAAFATFAESRAEAVLTSHVTLFFLERKRILDLAAKHRMALVAHRTELADDGALMSYSSSLRDQVRRAAQLADKVLRGTKPADIPVEQPTKFELVVNMKTAKALGITIPQSLLLQASRVIE